MLSLRPIRTTLLPRILTVAGIASVILILGLLMYVNKDRALAANDGMCNTTGFFKVAPSDNANARLTSADLERSDRATEWLKSMTNTRTTVTSDSTISLDQDYDAAYQGPISGQFDLEGRSYPVLSSIDITPPSGFDGSYRGTLSGTVTETPTPWRWIIQAYKRHNGVIEQVPLQTLADGVTGNFTIDLSGVDPALEGDWLFGLLDAENGYAPYGQKWPDALYQNLEVHQFVITDTEYYWSTAPAHADGTFIFPNSNTGRKLVRLVDTSNSTPEIIAEYVEKTGLLRSYLYESGDDGYGTAMEDRSFVYDQAIALFAAIGHDDAAFSKQLVDGMLLLQTTTGQHAGGFVFAAPQFSPTTTDPLYRTGAHAIAADALLAYIEKYPTDPQINTYWSAAALALDFIDATKSQVPQTAGLYLGGYGNYSGNPQTFDPAFEIEWASTEHNIDIWHTFVRAERVFSGEGYLQKAATLNEAITQKLYNQAEQRLNQGVSPAQPDTADPLDVNSWGAIQLYASGDSQRAKTSLDRVALFAHTREGVDGYAPFYDSPGYPGAVETVWYEGSFGVAMAYYRLADFDSYRAIINSLSNGQESDGSFRYATDQDPVHEIGQTRSVAGTAWYLLATTSRDALWNGCIYQVSPATDPLETPGDTATNPGAPNTGAESKDSGAPIGLIITAFLIVISGALAIIYTRVKNKT